MAIIVIMHENSKGKIAQNEFSLYLSCKPMQLGDVVDG